MKKFILYGMGEDNRRGRCVEMHTHTHTHTPSVEPSDNVVLYECDSNPNVWSEERGIFSPEKILNDPDAVVVIGCFPVKKVVESLRKIGCRNEVMVYPLFGAYFYVDDGMPDSIEDLTTLVNRWVDTNKDELLSLYNMNDSETHDILTEMILERSMPRLYPVPLERMIEFHWQPYFDDPIVNPRGDITLVDGGAFIGDSIEPVYRRYGERLKKIYAFEPNDENCDKMIDDLNRLGLDGIIRYIRCGMYDRNTELHFSAQEDWSKMSESGEIVVPVRTIDSVVDGVIGTLCIKMDIEDSEIAALHGAEKTIREHRPYMAICTYHRMADVLEIPRYIKSVSPDYDFYLRAGFHTECYAVPKNNV